MLSKNDIDTLGRLIGSDMVNRWAGLSSKLSSGSKITIANTGLYSSGKSSLFNALLGRVREDNMRFPVGAKPTTKKGDTEPLTGNIVLVDTPGIDSADSADDAEAFDMLMQSDVILMTHNVRIGPLNAAEADWLNRIAGAMTSESITDRLIFVSTWTEEIDDESDMQALREEIHRQVTGILGGTEIRFAEVSANMYKAGVEMGKEGLQAASQIPALRELVISAGKSYAQKAEALRRQELLRLCNDSLRRLNGKRREVSSEIEAKKNRVAGRYDGAFEKWRGILSRFTSMRSNVTSKLGECQSISRDSSFESRIYSM